MSYQDKYFPSNGSFQIHADIKLIRRSIVLQERDKKKLKTEKTYGNKKNAEIIRGRFRTERKIRE